MKKQLCLMLALLMLVGALGGCTEHLPELSPTYTYTPRAVGVVAYRDFCLDNFVITKLSYEPQHEVKRKMLSDVKMNVAINHIGNKGRLDDLEVDTCTAQITALVICGRNRLFGLLGRDSDIVIQWKDIEVIGDETILVNFSCGPCDGKSPVKCPSILCGLFK